MKLEQYQDVTGGLDGGTWVKINELYDNGNNFGVGGVLCNTSLNLAINPAMELTNAPDRYGSESHKPNLSVYFRSDKVNTNGLWYKWGSVREIKAG
ncbi:MAG: hypothetical protein E6K98_07050 [Thaumarchaeota archaeon]|nr:MAG: hypothetical protein E6K98_07050 [Nitrososphaerota archaeon]